MDTPACPALNGLAACDDRLDGKASLLFFQYTLVHIYSTSCLLFMIFLKLFPPYTTFHDIFNTISLLTQWFYFASNLSYFPQKGTPFGPLLAYLPATPMPMKPCPNPCLIVVSEETFEFVRYDVMRLCNNKVSVMMKI
ncbi:hypothetical protein TNIN_97911 [Trichonephila inaurata madagascariensis]|uniref:Uncharacterized protein n=1 Tax=Trichonephila inaurata madagascariensis TaxID=2747483 RepID=A0A8X6XMZ4_9ARAC|nr:hypothetical protein TNIN_97911 [Trichonephila inaurata madagascariensis]